MKKIADAGLIIGFLDRLDSHHQWAASVFEQESPPFYTAESILAEAAAVLGDADRVLEMLAVGDLVIGLDLDREVDRVRELLQKYRDRRMDLGDACCVRLAELLSGGVVYTVDRKDFKVYRKNGRQPLPCVFPNC
jgi:predicted nucleic acid-binding protein